MDEIIKAVKEKAQAQKPNPTRVKIFNSGNKRHDILENSVNDWLLSNTNIEIINILTTSSAAAYGGNDSFFSEELYLIVVYKD
jgi:hypothetical protein